MSARGEASIMVDIEIDGETAVCDGFQLNSDDIAFSVAQYLRDLAEKLAPR